MTIGNFATIIVPDLNGLVLTALNETLADATRAMIGWQQNWFFQGLVASSPDTVRRFVVPRDCYVESVAFQAAGMIGDHTAEITGDGAMANWAIEQTLTTSTTSLAKSTRTLYDNSTSEAGFRVFTQGSTMQVSVSTTNTTAGGVIQLAICLRQVFGR